MPRKITDEWRPDDRGRYRRKVGWWVDEHGKRKQDYAALVVPYEDVYPVEDEAIRQRLGL